MKVYEILFIMQVMISIGGDNDDVILNVNCEQHDTS